MLPGLISAVQMHTHGRARANVRLCEQREGIHFVVRGRRLETLSCGVIRVTRARLKIFCFTASGDILENGPGSRSSLENL